MRLLLLPTAVVLSLSLSACESSDPADDSPAPIADTPAEPDVIDEPMGDTSGSCRGSEDELEFRPTIPQLNLLTWPAFGTFLENLDPAEDREVIGEIVGELFGVSLHSAGAIVSINYCTHEVFEFNQCTLVPGFNNAQIENGVLSYEYTDTSGATVQVSLNDPLIDSGQLTTTATNGEVRTTIWSRDADGTERYDFQSTVGDVVRFVENPDCSATVNRIRFEDGVQRSSVDTTYTTPKVEPFSWVYEYCDYRSGAPVCSSSPE